MTRESLAAAGLINARKGPAKLLAQRRAHARRHGARLKVSAGAREKIEAAGGRVEE